MRLSAGIAPLADEQGSRHRRYTGVNVDDGTAREVERAVPNVADPATAPDPVGDGGVDDGDPHDEEDEVGRELEALDEGSRDEGRGDDGEHHLEDDEQQRWDAVVFHLIDVDARQSEEAQVSYERASFAECEAVAPQDPDDAHDGHGHEAVHERAYDVSGADEASVEEGQSRRHEQH